MKVVPLTFSEQRIGVMIMHSDECGPLDLVQISKLMELTLGRPEVVVALVDGPVAAGVRAMPPGRISELPGTTSFFCGTPSGAACKHGTFIASILAADRDADAQGVCPQCTFLARPVFSEAPSDELALPCATPREVAAAIIDCIVAGASIVNLSIAVMHASATAERELFLALDTAAARGVLVVAASGNHGTVGGTVITKHPWVIPVVACDLVGRTLGYSNLGASIGRHGLSAPGSGVSGLNPEGAVVSIEGTSVAAPFVTGAAALLWSEFPKASAATIKFALTGGCAGGHRGKSRRSVVPPLLDAQGAYESIRGLQLTPNRRVSEE